MTGPVARPRLAVAITRLGIPSEVWALRQARAFGHLDPVFLSWSVDPLGGRPGDLPSHLVDAPFEVPATLPRKLARRLGHPAALALAPAQRAALARALADTGAEAVLCHFAWTAIAVAQAAPPDLPVIWHVHGRDVSAMLHDAAYRAALARHLPRAAALVAVGRHQLDRLAPFGLPARTALIPCGAPLALFAAGPLPAQDDGPVGFVSVGRMSAEKGMEETFAAFERIAPELPEATLTLIGDGPLLAPLRARAAAGPAAGRIHLPGLMAPEAVAATLAGAQVYLQHSREVAGWVEGFGVTLTEAGATGLPLLAAASGGLVDQIVEGENGHLFAPGDIAAQAALMAALARDPARRARLGAGARRLAARFDATAQAAKLEAEITAVLAARGTGAAA